MLKKTKGSRSAQKARCGTPRSQNEEQPIKGLDLFSMRLALAGTLIDHGARDGRILRNAVGGVTAGDPLECLEVWEVAICTAIVRIVDAIPHLEEPFRQPRRRRRGRGRRRRWGRWWCRAIAQMNGK